MPFYTAEDLTEAMISYRTGEYDSLRNCASAFGIPVTTLLKRLRDRKDRILAHENQQSLTSTEESTLVK
jgi:hypothetical protein